LTTYKKSFGDREDANGTPDAPSYFQHTAGLTFKFGGKILMVMEYMIKMMRVQKLLV
jgi:hypothetical protein